ncbi:class I SAM-dependent methyltransferase [Haladaptatus sp. F3-133]|jgi:predicted O-methyltransferase YrrM|uniref:Class I SAM-dependent methyltransferase n=1 Tax=Halorutilus salinus TaxID=2487751 RepID=A0A9Q4C5H2_9EURY|nr:class I SAM-dependent methyltransferase [Halorutilus salinus]MCX2818656.1 class I SAM-dependent methyltransferase [Halorutilus salinus]
MYFAEENDRLKEIVRRIAERSPGSVTPRPVDALVYSVVRATSPDRCLEIGAYEGTTSLYIAQGLADEANGELVAVEVEESSARGARKHVEGAGVGDRVEVVTDDSLEYVPTLEGGFDLIFVSTPTKQHAEEYENVRPLLSDDAYLGIDNADGSPAVEKARDDGMDVLTFDDWSFALAQN